MSQNINYSIEKFSRATQDLAVSADSIQVRLIRAAEHLQILYDTHIPYTLQNEFADLISRLKNADLSRATDGEAVELAEKIVLFTFELHHWRWSNAGRK